MLAKDIGLIVVFMRYFILFARCRCYVPGSYLFSWYIGLVIAMWATFAWRCIVMCLYLFNPSKNSKHEIF